MRPFRPTSGLAAVCLLPLVAAACLKVPQQSASLTAIEATDVTASELQLRVFEAGRRLSSIIEDAADTIAARSPDSTIRRNALRWKVAAIPLIQEASLRPDPVVALADVWTFTMQLSDYLERGDGRDAFGDQQPIAIAATDTLERLASDLAAHVVGTTESKPREERLRVWAGDHPIHGPDLARESILSSDMKALSLGETSLTGTVASLQRNLVGINNRLGYVNEGIFKRVVWQGELAAGDVLPPILARARAAALQYLTEQERGLLGAVDSQRTAVFAALAVERGIVLDRVAMERATVLDAIRVERTATLAGLTDERVAVLLGIEAERRATLAKIDSVAQASIDHAGAVVGRLLLWTVLALVGLATFVGIGAVWITRSWRTAGPRG